MEATVYVLDGSSQARFLVVGLEQGFWTFPTLRSTYAFMLSYKDPNSTCKQKSD